MIKHTTHKHNNICWLAIFIAVFLLYSNISQAAGLRVFHSVELLTGISQQQAVLKNKTSEQPIINDATSAGLRYSSYLNRYINFELLGNYITTAKEEQTVSNTTYKGEYQYSQLKLGLKGEFFIGNRYSISLRGGAGLNNISMNRISETNNVQTELIKGSTTLSNWYAGIANNIQLTNHWYLGIEYNYEELTLSFINKAHQDDFQLKNSLISMGIGRMFGS